MKTKTWMSLVVVALLLGLGLPAGAQTSLYDCASTLSGTDGVVANYSVATTYATIPVEFVRYSGNRTYSANTSFGSGTADARMLMVRIEGDLTINSGATVTAAARERGMVLCVNGNLVVNGTLSMTARGAAGVAGDTLLVAIDRLQGVTNTIPAAGAAGASAAASAPNMAAGNTGTAGSAGGARSGGGGSGGVAVWSPGGTSYSGAGAGGTSYGGGSGGGGYAAGGSAGSGYAGAANGGVGGAGAGNGGYLAGGGAGNPGGAGISGAAAGSSGSGGTLIVLVKGNILVGSTGVISADGTAGGNAFSSHVLSSAGGGSGGGIIDLFCGNTCTNLGTVRALGGAGGTATTMSGSPRYPAPGSAGGAGSVRTGTFTPFQIRGRVTNELTGAGVDGVSISYSGGASPVLTTNDGYFVIWVSGYWSGSATASFGNGSFAQPTLTYANVMSDQNNQDFAWSPPPVVYIAGRVINQITGAGVDGATLAFSGGQGSTVSSGGGYYSNNVPYLWAGSVTATVDGATATPSVRYYSGVDWPPPTNESYSVLAPYAIDARTVLLLHGDDAAGSATITDSSMYRHPMSALGQANNATAASVFGGSSLYLDGRGDEVRSQDSQDWNFGTNNFTIDAWVRGDHVNAPASAERIMGQWESDGAGFALSQNWSAFNAATINSGLVGYRGAVFDGRYMYFPPYTTDGTTMHGRVLRFDTKGSMTASSSWTSYDAGNTDGLNTKGYIGGVFDGRYVYFVPHYDGAAYHGKVLRYDTRGSFGASSNWSAFDAGTMDGLSTRGYMGAVLSGRYIYFVPFNDVTGRHGRVLRYDTQGDFKTAGSWSAYDAGNVGGLVTKGYQCGVTDGRYVYFVPYYDGTVQHARVLRYDTQGDFKTAGSWSAYDAGNTGGLSTKGYIGGAFDGRYLYFAPYADASGTHGRVLRYDTQGSFSTAGSWSAYDAGAVGGLTTKGFEGAISDGRYVYFVPYHDGTAQHGRVLRYDTQGGFTSAGSWSAFDAGSVGANTKGFLGGAFDGRYIYLAPYNDGTTYSGKVLRYDTAPQGAFKLVWGEQALGGSFGGGPAGIGFCLNAGSVAYSLTSGENLDAGAWHHVAVTREGPALRLFVDGALKATNSIGTASVIDSPAPLALGSYPGAVSGFAGYLDEVHIVSGLARWIAPFTNELPAAPYGSAINVSGRLTSEANGAGADAVTIQLGTFAAATTNGGYYSRALPYGWSGAIAPIYPGAVITPASRVIDAATADLAGQDFGWQISTAAITSLSPTNTLGSGGTWVAANGLNFRDRWYSASWLYRKRVSIDPTQVAGVLTNYPMLISRVDADLRSTANGGRVGQTDGGDLLFTDATGTNKLAHEIEKYDPVTGELVAWVNVPLVATNRNTELNLYYGNAAAANQWNSTGTWNTNYKGVWHLNDRSASDDFAGTTLDTVKWGVWGSVTVNNRLSATTTTAAWNSSGVSNDGKQYFGGDFDVQVDFDASGWSAPPTDAYEADLVALTPTGAYSYYLCYYLYAAGTKTYGTWQNETSVGWGSVTAPATSGKLRLVRTGSTIYAYYWNGSAWVQVGTSFAGSHSAEVMHFNVQIVNRTTGRAIPATYFDNFVVNYGERVADSTTYANHGVNFRALPSAGIIATGRVFDGSNSYVEVPNAAATLENLQENSYSVQAWYRPTVAPVGGGTDNFAVQGVFMKQGVHEGLDVRPGFLEMAHWLTGDAYTGIGNTVPSAGQAYHMVGIVDRAAGASKLFVNGRGATSTLWTANTATREYSTMPWRIGIGGPAMSTYRWPAKGVIDEARLVATPLSSGWVATEYNNHSQPSTFSSFGSEEAGTAWTNQGVRVFVDGVQVQAVLVDSSQLLILVPAHAPGLVDVTVIGPDGATSTLNQGLYFGPYIAGRIFDAQTGNPIAGATVQFSNGGGTALTGAAGFYTQYVVYGWSGTLTPSYGGGALSPSARSVGAATAHLTDLDFAWISPPVVTVVTPGTGTVAGGQTVFLTGTNFSMSPLPAVKFGSSYATGVARLNDTTLSAVSPVHAVGRVDVSVVDPSGLTGTLTNGYRYVLAAPSIDSIEPARGSTLGGYAVQINYSGAEIWGYRRPVTLSPATSGTGLQVRVTLTTGTFDYGLAQTNGADLRFTQPDGTLLPHWIETWVTNGTSTVWVQVRDAGVSTLNISYGNPNATNMSNGSATFEFFDDFTGAVLNASAWSTSIGGATIAVAGGLVTLDTAADQGVAVISRSQTLPYRTEARAYFYSDYDSVNYLRFRWLESSTPADMGLMDDASHTAPQVVWQGAWSGTPVALNTFVHLRSARQASSVDWQIFTDAGGQLFANSYTPTASPQSMRFVVGDDATHGYGKLALDWVLTRKYVASEPAATLGSRQSGVLLDGVSASSVTILSSTSLLVVIPGHAVGSVSVSLLSPEGGSNTAVNAFLYLPAIAGRVTNALNGEGVDNVVVTLSNGGGSTLTAGGGYYAFTVESGWSGEATVALDPVYGTGSFAPTSRSYANVTTAQSSQNFAFTPDAPLLSGRIVNEDTGEGEDGFAINVPGVGATTTAGGGYYTIATSYNWSGTVTPYASASGIDPFTKLLLHMNGSGNAFVDSSPNNRAVSAFDNTVQSTAQSVFGGSSVSFDGSGDYLSMPSSSDLQFGAGDFTIQYWMRPTRNGAAGGVFSSMLLLIDNPASTFAGFDPIRLDFSTSGEITYLFSTDGATWWYPPSTVTGSSVCPLGVWTHVALVRNGSTIKAYFNGTETVSFAVGSTALFNSANPLIVGGRTHNSAPLFYQGFIDELRVDKGIARWTNNFALPAREYGSIGAGTFSPASRSLSNVRLNQPDQDFTWKPPYIPGNRYVSLTGLNQYPYTNWEMASRTLQAAINTAGNGETVWVAGGAYNISTVLTIAKPITVRSLAGAEATTIRRYQNGNMGVVTMTATNAVLDGFTVRDGFIHPGGYSGDAGGVYCSGGGVVRNCIIRDNVMGEAWKAAGLELRGSKAINCLIFNNSASGDYSPDSVGGVKISGGSMLINCVVYGNNRGSGGGGAGGVHAGGHYPAASGTNWVQNCIVQGNTATWRDPVDLLADGGSSGALLVQNTAYGIGSGDLQLQNAWQASALFANAAGGDFHPTEDSPGLNRGNNSYNPLATDADGNPRVSGSAIDLGAFEYANPRPRVGGRITHADTGAGVAGLTVTLSNGGGSATTDGYGYYSRAVDSGWSGDVTLPAPAAGSSFVPASRTLSNVTGDQYGNDFVWTPPPPVVSGRIAQLNTGAGVDGVVLTFSNGGGSTTTAAGGYYSLTVPRNWTGTVTPAYGSGSFSPASRSFNALVTDQAGQDFSWVPPTRTLAGRVTHYYTGAGVDGLTLSLSNGGGSTTTTNGGYYAAAVYLNWSGRVTPDTAGNATDTPAYRDYASVTVTLESQDYVWMPASPVLLGAVSNHYTKVGVGGITVSFSNGGGSTTTAGDGSYRQTLPWNWSGAVSLSYGLGVISPEGRAYANLQAAQAEQNYEWTPPARTIAGVVTDQDTGQPVSGANISFGSYGGAATVADGSYAKVLYHGWSGTATPSLSGGTFDPLSRGYANLSADQAAENYVWRANKVIAGRVTNQATGVGVDGVSLLFSGIGTSTTTNGGYYAKTVTYGYSGDVTLTGSAGATFVPAGRSYAGVTANQIGQNYSWSSPKTVSGRITNQHTGSGVDGLVVQFSNGGGNAATAGGGYYSKSLSAGWSGTLTPLASGSYSPESRTINNLAADTAGQDFSWTPVDPVITGRVTNHYTGAGADGVTIAFSAGGGSAVTADGGYFSKTVSYGWSGTLTPQSGSGGTFNPVSRSLNNVTANQGSQLFDWLPPLYAISGVVTNADAGGGEDGVMLTFPGLGSVLTAHGGTYTQWVYQGWSGNVTLQAVAGGTFSPAVRSYNNVTATQADQHYTYTPYREILGRIVDNRTGTGVDGVTIAGTNVVENGVSANGGYYAVTVIAGWSGTLRASFGSGLVTPASRSYASVTADVTGQDYTWQATYVIAGRIAHQFSDSSLPNVTVTLSGGAGSMLTTNGGFYSLTVTQGWHGVATPSYVNGTFGPANRSYAAILADQPGQDYAWTPPNQFAISGRMTDTIGGSGVDGAVVTFSGGQGTATTAGGGYFSKNVVQGWSGTLQPSHPSGGSFAPASRSVSTVNADVANQNFAWAPPVISGDRYVSPNGGNVYPYTNWAMAATALQIAVNVATNGETVWVTNGTYDLSAAVTISKSIQVHSMNGAAQTILRRSGADDYRVLTINHANAVVKGFAIENGKLSSGAAGVDLQSGYLVNSIVRNSAGAGVVLGDEVAARMANVLVVNNTGAGIAGVGVVVNCTVADNGGSQVSASQVYNCVVDGTIASPLIAYTMAAAPYGGTGNKSGDPLFADAAYHLATNSPAVNTGNNGYNTLTTDLEGNPRILGQIDMGVYEQAPGHGIAVALGHEPDPLPAGDVLMSLVTALNSGPDIAHSVMVLVPVPGTVTYLSNSVGGAYSPASGTWTIGTLTVGSVAQLKIWVRADAVGWITNVAAISAVDVTPENGYGAATNATQVLGPVAITNVLATTSSQNSTVQWESVVGMGYSVYSCDGAFTASPVWTQRAAMVASEEARNFIDQDAGASQMMRRFYQVTFAGHAPSASNVWGVIRRDVPSGFGLVSPPLRTDRRFDGQLGRMLGESLMGSDDGIGGAGDEVYILEHDGTWRLLYLDGAKAWREASGELSTYLLLPGSGFFVLRNAGSSARLTFSGAVGNDNSLTSEIVPGWNIVGFSEGKRLDVKATFADAEPKAASTEENADLVVMQNANGTWRRLMYVDGWGAPYDGNWFDLSTFAIVTSKLEPGQAYYYYRQSAAGTMRVRF